MELDYANLTGRDTSRLVRVASAVSRGVASVQRQQQPYAAAWHAANRVALTHAGPRWIVFGDSMSQGIGASAFDAGWVNLLHDRLALGGIDLPIVNLSASGARVPDLLEQQLPVWRSLPPAPGSRDLPDLITVLVGSNDLMSARYRDGLAGAVQRLVDELPDGAVIASLPQPRAAAAATNAVLARAQAAGRIHVVDMRSSGPSSWRGKLAADHFHPNDLGYAGIAEAFAPVVLDALGTSYSAP